MTLRPWSGDRQDYLDGTADLIDRVEPTLRAFTALDLAGARTATVAASAPLAGMPIAVKEIIDVQDWPVTFGSSTMTDRVAASDAEPVRRLREAGAVVLGITTSTPFACGTTTVTTNPVAPDHTPGGSSAGSGAAVGAGIVPVALASQSQASTLRPASYCGAWGYKPTHRRLPSGGMHRLADTLDDLGIIAASLADLRAVCDVLWEPRPTPPVSGSAPLRVGLMRLDDGDLPRESTRAALAEFIARIGVDARIDLVAASEELSAVDARIAGTGQSCFDIFAGESEPVLAPLVQAGEPDPRLAEMVRHAHDIGEEGLRRALAHREELRALWATLQDRFDVILALATTNPAPPGHATTGCRRMPATSSLLGIPALTAPWLTVEGLPQGIQLLGFDGRDEELLDAAARLQHVIDTGNEDQP